MGTVRDGDERERPGGERLYRDPPERLSRRAHHEKTRRIDPRDEQLRSIERRPTLYLDPCTMHVTPLCLGGADRGERDRGASPVRVRSRDLGDPTREPVIGQSLGELGPAQIENLRRRGLRMHRGLPRARAEMDPERGELFERVKGFDRRHTEHIISTHDPRKRGRVFFANHLLVKPFPSDPALERLRAVFADVPSVLVCYSGGTDSALVLAVAHALLGDRAIGMTAVSPSLAPSERDEAVQVAKEIGARHELVASNEIEDESYAKNGADRCFHCKSELYRIAEKKRVEWALAVTMNGTNTDDLGDYRPGLEAAKNASVKSPLVEAGLDKAEVRRLASLLGLRVWDKPAAACLSSRLPYGTRVTRERLEQIATFEAGLRQLGLRQVRVRWHGLPEDRGAFARVEVEKSELLRAFEVRDAIVAAGKSAGFVYVTLDLEGYRVGSHNAVLVGKSLRVLS